MENLPEQQNRNLQKSSTVGDLNTEGEIKMSIYKRDLAFNKKEASKDIAKLSLSFPDLQPEFFKILLERLDDNDFTNNRVKDAVNFVIDNFKYNKPKIADIISFDINIELFTYHQILKKAEEYGKMVFENYRPVDVIINNNPLWASVWDIKKYSLELFKKGKNEN